MTTAIMPSMATQMTHQIVHSINNLTPKQSAATVDFPSFRSRSNKRFRLSNINIDFSSQTQFPSRATEHDSSFRPTHTPSSPQRLSRSRSKPEWPCYLFSEAPFDP